MNIKRRRITTISLIVTIFMMTTIVSNAAIKKIVAFESGTNYEYDFGELDKSYALYQMGKLSNVKTNLYKDYMNKTVIAFFDNIRGYVDFKDVEKAYAKAQLKQEIFNTDDYTEKTAKQVEEELINLKEVIIDEKGEIIYKAV